MIKLYNGNGGEVEITPEDDSYRLTELMGADEVVLKFALPDYLTISAGAYITYKGDRYEVESEDSVRMIHTEMYEYTITLSAPRAHLRRYIVREKGGEGRITFFLTAKPREHLDLIVHNLNEREAGWSVGACLDGSEKTIEYSTTNALDALSKLAEAYSTEWECEGRTLSLRKAEYHKDSPLTVSYGKGKGLLSGLERNPAEEQPVGTLYVTGTDRNIDPTKYKSKTLHLPEGATKTIGDRTYTVTSGGRAITVGGSAPGAVEGAYTDTDIYPSREGTVKVVTIKDKEKAFVDFTDPSIPADLDFEQCLIPGREMKLTFQTGMLSGRTFGAKYVHKDRRFEIVPEEIDGVLMPSAPFLPKEGDRYGVFEIALPESYIRSAEGRLLDSAVQYLEGLETSRYSYRAAVDPLWLKKQWTKVGHKVRVGAYVKLAGDPITDGGATLRITGIKEYLTDPYAPEVTLSDRATGRGGLTSIIRKAVHDDLTSTKEASTRTAVEQATRSYKKAEELTKALEEALSADFDAKIRPLAVHTMQVLVGDKSLQFAYVESKSSTKEVPLPLTYDTATKSLHIDQAYLQHKTLGVEVTTAHTAKDFRTWTIAPTDYSPKGTAPLYLYARVPREGDGGTFVIDTKAHDFDEEAGYYHLWSGMLTPTDDGARWEYMPMHGFTEITPGMISSPRFTSPDGRLVIDMVKGYFRFKTDKSTFSVNADNPDGVYIRGGMISVGGQNVTMEEAFEKEQKAREEATAEAERKLKAEEEARTKADEETRTNMERELQAATNALLNELHEGVARSEQKTDELHGYVDGAFRDGVVDGAEATAIKTYIQEVDAQWQSALGAYEKVYTNTLLTGSPKTALLDCKTTLAGKVSDLTGYIKTAISDGKATAAEVTETDRRYTAYKTALKDFQKALKVAEEAIRDAGKGDGAVMIGEVQSLEWRGYYNDMAGAYKFPKHAGDTVIMAADGSNSDYTWKKGQVYISVWQYSGGKLTNAYWKLLNSEGAGTPGPPGPQGPPGKDGAPGKDGKDGVGADYSKEIKELQDGLSSAETAIDTLNNCRQMLANNEITLDKLPDSLRWIYEAFANGKTEVEGGLILSKYIGLSNSSDKVTSYLSGQDGKGAHMLAAGVTGLADQDAVSFINYDGSAKLGPLTVNKEGILYLDQNATKLEKPVPNRLYMGSGGIFSYDSVGAKVFGASVSGGFKSERVNIGGGGSSYIKSPGGLTLQGDTNVLGDLTERGKRVHLDTTPRIVDLTESASVSLTADDRVVTLWNEAHTSSHVTVTLPSATEVPEGWQCLVTTFGPVTSGSITMTTKSSTEKWFWGSEGVGYTHDYSEKTNMIWIIRIPKRTANGTPIYWAAKEIRAY